MKTVFDPGHKYELLTLDDPHYRQSLQFVKRWDPKDPKRFPGNFNAYPGTTLQSVMRCLCERVRYLQNQIWAPENCILLKCLQLGIWFLEFRAARRHGHTYFHGLKFAEQQPMCPHCGHTVCEHK
jgi:hypothetical protein